MSGGVVRFGVSLPPDVAKEFDEVISKMGYKNRSKAILDAVKSFLAELKWTTGGSEKVVGSLSFLYDHEVKGLEDYLTDVEHEFRHVITATLHIHVGDKICHKIIAIEGSAEDIKKLALKIASKKGVEQLKVNIATL
ncbi:MAG: nickel-responsive transcriptional regulator NikR [Candidatus Nezhaarchaeales archaeon]